MITLPSNLCVALQAVVDDGGQVTMGAVGQIRAVAITPKGMFVGLKCRKGESWPQALVRFDATVVQAVLDARVISNLHL